MLRQGVSFAGFGTITAITHEENRMHETLRIEARHDVLLEKPVIKGTRISVELLLRELSQGAKIEDLLLAYPQLQAEDIFAALAYSAEVIGKEQLLAAS